MFRMLPIVCLAALVLPARLAAQDTTHKAPKIRRNPDLISQQEIEAAPEAWQTGYALVEQLRGNWLRRHGISSVTQQTPLPQVYVAGMKRGGPSSLEDIPRASIREIQHLGGTDATQRFGQGHESGAILVILK